MAQELKKSGENLKKIELNENKQMFDNKLNLEETEIDMNEWEEDPDEKEQYGIIKLGNKYRNYKTFSICNGFFKQNLGKSFNKFYVFDNKFQQQEDNFSENENQNGQQNENGETNFKQMQKQIILNKQQKPSVLKPINHNFGMELNINKQYGTNIIYYNKKNVNIKNIKLENNINYNEENLINEQNPIHLKQTKNSQNLNFSQFYYQIDVPPFNKNLIELMKKEEDKKQQLEHAKFLNEEDQQLKQVNDLQKKQSSQIKKQHSIPKDYKIKSHFDDDNQNIFYNQQNRNNKGNEEKNNNKFDDIYSWIEEKQRQEENKEKRKQQQQHRNELRKNQMLQQQQQQINPKRKGQPLNYLINKMLKQEKNEEQKSEKK